MNIAQRIANFVRNILSDRGDDYTFYKFEDKDLSFEKKGGLYLHIPFCTNMCPYCPYYKVPYDRDAVEEFTKALIKEIKLYSQKLGKKAFTSLYIGGGSPLLMIDKLSDIVKTIRKYFVIDGSLGIEVHPNNVTTESVKKIKGLGFSLVSLGVQSFQQKHLDTIGRNYDFKTSLNVLRVLQKQNFKTLNIDLMFVLEGQTLESLKQDLETAIKLNVGQVTCYPLFTFPYTTIGQFKRIKNIKLPNHFNRRKMYYFIHDFLKKHGYKRTSVWSFNKKSKKPYASVTRDYYLGFGPSSATYNGSAFYFNTFSVSEYIKKLNNHKLPIALKMKVSPRLEKLFWLYWRLYETAIPKKKYEKQFGSNIKNEFGGMLKLLKWLGFFKYEDDSVIVLNKRGSHWIHLAQNYFALDYVSKIWSICQKNSWPDKIEL